MHSLENELQKLHARGLVDDPTAVRLIAIERREIFSVFRELRAASYLAVAMIVTGAGILLKKHGAPLVVLAVLLVAAAVCYATAERKRMRREPRAVTGEYVLLLGALLLSAGLGYAESLFAMLDERWTLHLLLLATVHAVAAYRYESTLVLGASLTSLAGWFGAHEQFGLRLMAAALVIVLWRSVHVWRGGPARFVAVFDHYSIHLWFLGALTLVWNRWTWIGLVAVLVLAAVLLRIALLKRREVLAVYAVVYTAVAIAASLIRLAWVDPFTAALILFIVAVSAVVALFQLHRRLREGA